LALFSEALRADRVGQRFAILDPDDTIVKEIGGISVPDRVFESLTN